MSSETSTACSSSSFRGDASLAEEVKLHRAQQSEAEYVGYCALLSRTGRLRSGKLRAMVWRDIVLGRQKVAPVPLLGDGIIRQFQEETRSQATGSAAAHSRENTNMTESFDSTVSRPTPRLMDEKSGAGSSTAAEDAGMESPAQAAVVEDVDAGPPLSARSEGGNSDWSAASPNTNINGSGTTHAPHHHHSSSITSNNVNVAKGQRGTPGNTWGSPAGSPASLHRRHRHRSVEPPRPSHGSPLSHTTAEVERAHAAPLMFVPVRRRAVSQLSHRVKSDTNQFNDLLPADQDGGASSSNELSSSILRPMAWYHLPENCQPRVVEADVERSLWKLYTKSEERVERRRRLKNMILRVLLHNPDRFYYQGLHELMGFVMYTLSPYLDWEEVVSVCEGLLNTRWRKFSARRLTNSEAMLYAVHAIIAQEDPPLAAALEWCGVGPESHYAVSWVITWYVHSVESVTVLTRLFDYFIADATGNAVIYFTAAFVISQRKTIFEWIHSAKEEIGISCESPEASEDGVVLMARVYAQLSRLPGNVLHLMDAADLEALLTQADEFATLHCEVVEVEETNFLSGDVKKLGMLSNKNTRNAALRLLWHFLPREWRNPAKVEKVRRFVFWTSVMVAATAVVVGTAAADVKQGGWVRNLFH